MRQVVAALVLAAAQAASQPAPFETPLSREELSGKQAVVETTLGAIIIDLLPEAAPNHVGYFLQNAREGLYDGTAFHRAIRHGIVQGGDPLTKEPANRARFGTGGLGVLKAEISGERHTRGAVAAVLVPGRPDSAGTQFFICVTDQPALDGQYTVFGRVSEGINVVTKISEVATDAQANLLERIEVRSVTIRDTPPPAPEPFSADTIDELKTYRAILETGAGPITIEPLPDKAPNHVRQFLRLAAAGVYDGTAFHRVARGFVIQTGWLPSRREPLSESQQRLVRTLAPEFNDTRHEKGTVSMARGDDPASAETSFFIVTAAAPALDRQYSAFGRVVDGLTVVEAIEASPTTGETPVTRIELVRVRVERVSRTP